MRLMMLLLLPLFLLPSCHQEEAEEEGLSIIAADFPSYDAARAVLGGTDGLEMLIPPGVESHSYDPTPRDAVRIAQCDLVIYTGGPSDEWLSSMLEATDDPPQTFVLTEQVPLLYAEEKEGMEEDHHHHESELDEHVWTSPANEIVIINNLAAALSSIEPEGKERFMENAGSYISRIARCESEIREIVRNAERNTLIFASRFPLLYFVREYGLDYFAAFPGCAEESEPSARTVAFLIDKARELGVPAVLTVEFSSPMIASVIADEAGCSVREFSTLHAVTAADFLSGKDYVDFMEGNAEILREVLN